MANFVLSVLGGAFICARFGLFGVVKITAYADNEYESVSNCIFFHEARWIPGDLRSMVHTRSIRPIEFVQSKERLRNY